MKMHQVAAACALVLVVVGCGDDDDSTLDTQANDGTSLSSDSPPVDTGSGEDTEPVDETDETDETPPEVTSTITGVAVAGNNGGEEPAGTPPEEFGSTDGTSEAARYDDGTCIGWTPVGRDTWTEGLETGATVTIRDAATGADIGSGTIESSSYEQLESGEWICMFNFTATVTGTPDALTVQVADLEPWPAEFDAETGGFLVEVSTPESGTDTTVPPVDTTIPPVDTDVGTISPASTTSP